MASPRVTVRWSGLKELQAAFNQLADDTSRGTARNALKRGLTKAAQPMADRMKELARDREVAESVVVSPNLKAGSVGDIAYARAKAANLSDAQAVTAKRDAQRAVKGTVPAILLYVGPSGKPASKAHLEEFGTKPHTIKPKDADGLAWPDGAGGKVFAGGEVHHPGAAPHPFMRPAFEETRDAVVAELKPIIAREIAQAAARAARKRARAAARA
jgi:HK97 gp10 family phage protein